MVLEHVWNEAQVNRDAPVLDALVADTFTNTEFDGEVSDKTKFLADLRAGIDSAKKDNNISSPVEVNIVDGPSGRVMETFTQ